MLQAFFRTTRKNGQKQLSPSEELLSDGFIEDAIPIMTARNDRFRIHVYNGKSAITGAPCRWLVPEFKNGEWNPMIGMHEDNLSVMSDVLQKVADFLSDNPPAPHYLPMIALREKRYFVDERLMQLRNIDNPQDCIELK